MTNQLVTINNHDLAVKEFNGQRVVTFKEVDTCHERPDGTAKRNFNSNQQHFIPNEDYFQMSKKEFSTEFVPNSKERGNPNNQVILLTVTGYLMLVKSFTDNLAWKVQRELVNSYFKISSNSKFVTLEQLQDIENKFDSMQKSFDLFQTNFTQHIDSRLNTMGNAFTYIQKLLEQNSKPLFVVDADWKSKMFKRVDELVNQQPQKYSTSKMVLREIYNKMNSVYGVVWDQESRDFRTEHNIVGKPQTMELISDKEQLKSLFECILNDMFINENKNVVSEKVIPSARDIIAPLIEKYNDKSKGGTVTFRKVYKNMDVNWYSKQKAYVKCHRANNPPQKVKLIENDFKLMNRFKKTVKGMLAG